MKNFVWVFVFVFCCSLVFASDYRYSFDNETACGCSIGDVYLVGGFIGDLSVTCSYYHEPDKSGRGIIARKLHSKVNFWDKVDSTKRSFELHKEQQYEPDLKRLKGKDDVVIVESFEDGNSFSLISRSTEAKSPKEPYFVYGINRQIRYDDYALIEVSGVWMSFGANPQDASVVSMVDSMEACMKKAVDESLRNGGGKASIKVEHEHPFPYLLEDAWFSSSDSMVGGELRATVLDEDGDGDKGELVVFYVEKDDALYDVISDDHFVRFPGSTTTWRELESEVDNAGLLSYVGYGVTDKNGVAKTSYLFGDRLNMQKLSAQIVLGEGVVEGKVHAAVIDLDEKEVEMSSSVDLKFDHIAQIVRISGNGVPDSLAAGDMQGVVSGPGQVRVKRVLVEPLEYKEVKAGYELMPGDIINADADSEIEIMWVNGDRVVAKLPRYVSVAEKVVYPSASIVLLADAYSSGFPSTLGKGGDIAYGMAVEKGWKFLVDTIKSEIPGSGLVENGYDFVVGISEKFGEYDAVDLSKFSIISRIRVKSQFVVDATGDDVKISVLEGNPDVVSSGGEVSLVEGEAVVFDSGEMGDVEKSSKVDFDGWEIPEVRVLGVEESGGFSFGWVLFFGLVGFVLWLVFSARNKNGFKDKLSGMLEGK